METHQSWGMPISLGALATFVLLVLFTAGQRVAVAPIALTSMCCCAAGFLPYGFIPAWLAARRDPTLSGGQGFAVSFIGVGLGTVAWAVISMLSAQAFDGASIRESLATANANASPDERMSEEQIDEIVAFAARVFPYVPAIYATVTTVLAGFVGMIVAGMIHGRRRRSVPESPDRFDGP